MDKLAKEVETEKMMVSFVFEAAFILPLQRTLGCWNCEIYENPAEYKIEINNIFISAILRYVQTLQIGAAQLVVHV